MSTIPEPREAAKRLLEAEETLQRALRACEELEQSSQQLADAKRDLTELTRATRDLVKDTATVAKDALVAVRAVQSLNPAELFARLDRVVEATATQGRAVVRAVWLSAALMTLLLLTALLFLHK